MKRMKPLLVGSTVRKSKLLPGFKRLSQTPKHGGKLKKIEYKTPPNKKTKKTLKKHPCNKSRTFVAYTTRLLRMWWRPYPLKEKQTLLDNTTSLFLPPTQITFASTWRNYRLTAKSQADYGESGTSRRAPSSGTSSGRTATCSVTPVTQT